MTQVGSVYGQALYSLASEEAVTLPVLEQMTAMARCFSQEPAFVRLLDAPNLSKVERCRIVDDSFRGRVHPYVLNFMKILTEKGYMCFFHDCCKAYHTLYNQAHGILVVNAVTAIALNRRQSNKLKKKLSSITGKTIELVNRIDPACLGGIRLDYDGKRVDDTVAHRLDEIRCLLNNTVL